MGRLIKKARADLDVPLAAVARVAGVSREMLRKIETGKRLPSNRVVLQLIDIFELEDDVAQRWLTALYRERNQQHRVVGEQAVLRRMIKDPGSGKLASRISGEITEEVQGRRTITAKEMHQVVADVVKRCLRDWEFL